MALSEDEPTHLNLIATLPTPGDFHLNRKQCFYAHRQYLILHSSLQPLNNSALWRLISLIRKMKHFFVA